jgi:hypothetical protein
MMKSNVAMNQRLLTRLLYALLLLAILNLAACGDTIPFNADVWKKAGGREPDNSGSEIEFPRHGMAKDLISRRVIYGKTEKEVLDLLGQPSSDSKLEGGRKLVYWLGPDRHFIGGGIDSEWLVLVIDDTGRVKEC